MFNGLEQVDECVIAVYDALGRLVHKDVTRIPIVLETGTYNK